MYLALHSTVIWCENYVPHAAADSFRDLCLQGVGFRLVYHEALNYFRKWQFARPFQAFQLPGT